jgi:ABC-2 type transport system ATP-binding protein
MTDRPVRYSIISSDDRALAAVLIARPAVQSVNLNPTGGLEVQVNDLGTFASELPTLTRRHDLSLFELSPSDESLESVFAYLVDR